MNTLFALEVHSCLTDDKPNFGCTVTDDKFHAKATEFVLHRRSTPGVLDEKALCSQENDRHVWLHLKSNKSFPAVQERSLSMKVRDVMREGAVLWS